MTNCRQLESERINREFATRDERHGRQGLRRQAADCQSELEELRRVLKRQSIESQKELARLAERVRQAELERDRFKRLWEDLLESHRTQQQLARINKRLGKPFSAPDAH